MTQRPDVLVSKVQHLLDPSVDATIQGVCTTNQANAWTWVMRGGPWPEKQWLLTLLAVPNMQGAYAMTVSVDGVSVWKHGHGRNNTKYAKILARSLKDFKMKVPGAQH